MFVFVCMHVRTYVCILVRVLVVLIMHLLYMYALFYIRFDVHM